MYWGQNWARSSQQCKLLPQNKEETQVHREHWQAEFCYQSSSSQNCWSTFGLDSRPVEPSTLPWDLQIRDLVVTEAGRLDREVSFPWAALTENHTLGDLREMYTLTVLGAVGEIIASAGWTPHWGSKWSLSRASVLVSGDMGSPWCSLAWRYSLTWRCSLQYPLSLFHDCLFPTSLCFHMVFSLCFSRLCLQRHQLYWIKGPSCSILTGFFKIVFDVDCI